MKLSNKKGQGTTEYVVIVALVVGLAVLLWRTLESSLQPKIADIGAKIANPVK